MNERGFLTPSSWDLQAINEQQVADEVRPIHSERDRKLDVAEFGKGEIISIVFVHGLTVYDKVSWYKDRVSSCGTVQIRLP